MFVYRFNVLEKLKDKGYSSYTLLHEKILSPTAVQTIRDGRMIGINVMSTICDLLQMQPGSVVKWIPDKEEKEDVDL